MNFQDTLDELNITLGDSEDVTFTPEEKNRALQKAWNDSYVVKDIWDSSLTFTDGTFQYAIPTGVKKVKDIYIKPDNSQDEPEKIDSTLWEVVGSNIHFKNNASGLIPTGWTLYIKGAQKLDYASDTIDSTSMQEYVIALGGYNTLTLLGYKKANLFLKNDTTMAELISLRREFKQEVLEFRAKLPRSFENA